LTGKNEVKSCLVSEGRIRNLKNWYGVCCIERDIVSGFMLILCLENRILYFLVIKRSFLFMVVFGTGMRVVHVPKGRLRIEHFGIRNSMQI